MPTPPALPIRLVQVVTGALLVVGAGSAAGAAGSAPRDHTQGRPAACAGVSTDPADFPGAVPLPQGEYTVRGYLRADCRQLLDLAMDTDDLGPERRLLVRRLRANDFRGVVWTSRTVEVQTGPESEPEQREEFKVRARGHGLRVTVELGFVGAAPRWGGTALVRYVLSPLR